MPLTRINDAMRQVIISGVGVQEIQRQYLILLAWLVASLLVAIRFFRWQARWANGRRRSDVTDAPLKTMRARRPPIVGGALVYPVVTLRYAPAPLRYNLAW